MGGDEPPAVNLSEARSSRRLESAATRSRELTSATIFWPVATEPTGGGRVELVPRIAHTLLATAGAAPVGGRKPTAPLIGCRRSTLVAESLRRSIVPVAPGPIALPPPPAAPGACHPLRGTPALPHGPMPHGPAHRARRRTRDRHPGPRRPRHGTRRSRTPPGPRVPPPSNAAPAPSARVPSGHAAPRPGVELPDGQPAAGPEPPALVSPHPASRAVGDRHASAPQPGRGCSRAAWVSAPRPRPRPLQATARRSRSSGTPFPA